MYTYFWDIETSKIMCDNGEEMQVTYLSNILKMNYLNGEIVSSIFFRTIEETVEHMRGLEDCIFWSHNLDYELTFLLRDLGEVSGEMKEDKKGNIVTGIYGENLQNIILRDKHSPLSIKLDQIPNITFRDSYALFNKGVKALGEDINLPKLDYDYKEVRLPWDRMEPHDYDYNERDNYIVAISIWNFMCNNKIEFEDIPLTFTSLVKRKRKQYINENFGKKAITKFYFDRNNQYKDFRLFELQLKTYQGGITASNHKETGMLISKGTYSVDLKSSYPYQMCTRYFPIFNNNSTKYYTGVIANEVFKESQYKGFFGTFTFTNIRIKNRNYLLNISSSQISKGNVSVDKKLYNGKLINTSTLTIPCNNIDIDTINLTYEYDKIVCEEIYTTTSERRLRQEEISFLLDAFNKKETVKDKKSFEYTQSKVYINGMYGIKVTAPIKGSYTIENGDIEQKEYFNFGIEERKEIYNKFINEGKVFGGSIDIFSDGCYITSYARYMLMYMMVNLVDKGCHIIYSDTDSIKFYLVNANEKTILNYLTTFNDKIIKENKRNPRFKKFKESNHIADNVYNKICKMGIWELETVDENDKPLPIEHFITFGAKKYAYIDRNKVYTTVAGCNKFNPSIVINNLAKLENISLLDAFKIVFARGTQFDESASGRTTSYAEKRNREDMELLTYKGRMINQYGGIIIKDTTYTLNVTFNDSKILGLNSIDEVLIKINLKGEIDYGEEE